MSKQEDYITASEAREMMGVSEGKLSLMLKNGEMPYQQPLRDKRMKLIKRSDVEAWIARAGPRPTPRKRDEERELAGIAS